MRTSIIIAAVLLIGGFIIWSTFLDQKKEKSGTSEVAVQNMDTSEFMQHIKNGSGIVIDVRTQEEYDKGYLAETNHHFNLLNGDFEASLDSLDKDEIYYLYCRTGNRSGQAAELMVENGFSNVYNIGGFQDLVDAGLEAEK